MSAAVMSNGDAMKTRQVSEDQSNNNSSKYLEKEIADAELEKDEEETVHDYEYDEKDDDTGCPDLDTSISEAEHILHEYLRNKFEEAEKMALKWEKHSLYYSLVKSYIGFVHGMVTIEKPAIEAGKKQLAKTLSLCNRKRKQNSIVESLSSYIWKPDYDEYTDEEVHAELIYGEIEVMQTMLTFFGDQNLIALVRGAFRMRAANNAYKLCVEIRENRKIWNSEYSRLNFDAGVFMGNGGFQLLISHLPTRIIKLLTVAGFSGDREVGLFELHKATDEYKTSARYKIAELVVCVYNMYVEQVFGTGEGDCTWAERLTNIGLAEFPGGVFSLFLAGRLRAVTGDPDLAIEHFNECVAIPKSFKNLDNVCYWDLAWCYAIKGDWLSAAKYALIMTKTCQWSPATNQYQYACFLAMEMEKTGDSSMRAQVDEAMALVPTLKVRYAGKSIPPEKYAITKAERYLAGDKDIVLPAFELFYVWNIFAYAGGALKVNQSILDAIESKFGPVQKDLELDDTFMDKYCYLLLLKGVTLRNMSRHLEAIDCFVEILENEDKIYKDTYIPPHAAFELGLTYSKVEKFEEAKLWLERARNDYTGFLIESMVHLRVHSALGTIKILEKAVKQKKPSMFKRISSGTFKTLSRGNSNASLKARSEKSIGETD